MRISVIVPTYNRRNLLNHTLYYLSHQELQEFFDIEIIIVDDGSTDGTSEFMDDYKTKISNLIYLYRPRDHEASWPASYGNPASVRNLGIQQSSGAIVVFLDCGILIPPNFMGLVAERYRTLENQVLVHYTVGLLAPPDDSSQQILTNLSPNTIFQEAQRLAQMPEWIDGREGLFNLVNNQLDHLPAPWTLAWSCALSIPMSLLKKVGGFDESFQGWGGEDTDLGYRLYQSGASFVATRDCIAFHLPHERVQREERFTSDRINRKKLHKKVFTFATELYYYYPGPYYNQVLTYYNHLVLMDTVPFYASTTLVSINKALCNDATPTLLIGTDCKFIADYLPTTHNFVHNLSTFNNFCQWFPDREIRYLLGCDTFYADKYFETIILTDFIRLIPDMIQLALFKELHRIGQNIFCLYTSAYVPPSHKLISYQRSPFDEMKNQLEQLHLQLVCIAEIDGVSIFKVQ